jgi:hypothetical protein
MELRGPPTASWRCGCRWCSGRHESGTGVSAGDGLGLTSWQDPACEHGGRSRLADGVPRQAACRRDRPPARSGPGKQHGRALYDGSGQASAPKIDEPWRDPGDFPLRTTAAEMVAPKARVMSHERARLLVRHWTRARRTRTAPSLQGTTASSQFYADHPYFPQRVVLPSEVSGADWWPVRGASSAALCCTVRLISTDGGSEPG